MAGAKKGERVEPWGKATIATSSSRRAGGSTPTARCSRNATRRVRCFFEHELVEDELRVSYDRQELRGEIYAHCQVLEERHEEGEVIFRVRAAPTQLARLRAA